MPAINYQKGDKLGECVYLDDASPVVYGQRRRRALFKCQCGNEFIAIIDFVKRGHTTGCGCLTGFLNKRRKVVIHENRAEYRTWIAIKTRCYNQKVKSYKDYGARGIKICERWNNSFDDFLSDMGKRPTRNHSIERLRNDGDYEPGNCKWATIIEQARNRRNNVFIEHNGISKCVTDWANDIGVSQEVLWHRLNTGMSPQEALTHKLHSRRPRKNTNI